MKVETNHSDVIKYLMIFFFLTGGIGIFFDPIAIVNLIAGALLAFLNY